MTLSFISIIIGLQSIRQQSDLMSLTWLMRISSFLDIIIGGDGCQRHLWSFSATAYRKRPLDDCIRVNERIILIMTLSFMLIKKPRRRGRRLPAPSVIVLRNDINFDVIKRNLTDNVTLLGILGGFFGISCHYWRILWDSLDITVIFQRFCGILWILLLFSKDSLYFTVIFQRFFGILWILLLFSKDSLGFFGYCCYFPKILCILLSFFKDSLEFFGFCCQFPKILWDS